ncbi:inorganic pyrophosphatase [Lasiosphaeria hispida]|uniref:Inorganic pyrophosphatase n=1 Tax=Lasiosphaeria hispida TaxID=260671 RepID=A0AAJ0H9Y8_9PEZI|nr:inorganic pyrophosphatase [Lasiosphaeria hispida]
MSVSESDSCVHPDKGYALRTVGRPYTKDRRVFFERKKDGIPVSPFHDIPLHCGRSKCILNMVVEVPRWTNAKWEISRSQSLSPIVQDTLHGEVRFAKNCFPYKGYIWNYGALPQAHTFSTWEDPRADDITEPATEPRGDNDPLDACEIGRVVATVGEVKQVKALGVLGLIDNGETDWKVIVIDVNDPLAEKLDDIEDVEEHLPGLLDATRDWFRIYKMPDGFPPNDFLHDGGFKDRKSAQDVIQRCSHAWRRLIEGKVERGDVSLDNTTLSGTPGKLDPDDVDLPPNEDLPPARIEQDLDEWHFFDREEVEAFKDSLEQSSLHIRLDL